MQLSDKENDLLDKYFSREATEEELREIELLKESSDPFREEFLTQKAIISSLKAQERARKFEAVRAMVSAHQVDLDTNPSEEVADDVDDTPVVPLDLSSGENEKRSTQFTFMKYAAALIILIAASILFFNVLNTSQSPESLYAAYYQPLDGTILTRDRQEDQTEGPLDTYNKGNYSQAIIKFKELINQNKSTPMTSIYLGISLLEVGKLNEARATFKEIFKKYPNDFSGQHAEWYLALLLLKEDAEQAKEAFQQIADQGGMYENQANKVLEEM